MIELTILLFFVLTSIWVLIDTHKIGVKKGQISGSPGPWGWFFLCLFVWPICFPFYLTRRRKYKAIPLLEAAKQGDVARIEEYIARGVPVNAKDIHGNTALHYAYYHDQKEAIQRLIAFGADIKRSNKEGDTPPEMQEIANAERLVISGASLLNEYAEWRNIAQARSIYNQLRDKASGITDRGGFAVDVELRIKGTRIVTKAIVKTVLRNENRLQVLFLAIKLGIADSERQLSDILDAYGDRGMAEDYLNCGSRALHKHAENWAARHSYQINSGIGSHRVNWGSF